jgi:hypothetical protein
MKKIIVSILPSRRIPAIRSTTAKDHSLDIKPQLLYYGIKFAGYIEIT